MSQNTYYEKKETLGQGGMGTVYKAWELPLGRFVAFKTIRKEYCQNKKALKRFLVEAQTAASLNHPNIVTIYAIGEQDGEHFIAMEHVDGVDLAKLITQDGRREPRDAVDIISQTSEALEEAHGKNIIHRDIKPPNILMDKNGLVKVADFGLAGILHGGSSDTELGARFGTPRYRPPEQIEGNPLDARSDIYSLGVVFYEILAGQVAFQANDPLVLVRQIVDKPFPRIQERNQEVDDALSAIIDAMVAKDMSKRYPSAASLIADLDAWLDNGSAPFATGDGSYVEMDPTHRRRRRGKTVAQEFDVDCMVHYVDSDRQWADWVVLQLRNEGYSCDLLEWDYRTPNKALRKISKAQALKVFIIAVVSPTYLRILHNNTVWSDAMMNGRLKMLPIRVVTCTLSQTFGTNDFIDMVELDADQGNKMLLEEIMERLGPPSGRKTVSESQTPDAQDAGGGPAQMAHAVWKMPHSHLSHVVGRGELLNKISQTLIQNGGVVTLVPPTSKYQGIGVTQLALEYATVNRAKYSVIAWVRGRQRTVMRTDYGNLAKDLGLPNIGERQISVSLKAVKKWFTENDTWLIIIDDASRFQSVRSLLPKNPSGHVIITSSNCEWPQELNPIHVGPLERSQSIEYLFTATNERNDGAAAALSATLYDCPMVLHLAGAYISETKITIDEYVDLYINRRKAMWGFKSPPKDAVSLAKTGLSLALERLAVESPDGLCLLKFCAYCAPDELRATRLLTSAKKLPKPLMKTVANPKRFTDARSALKRLGLVTERDDILEFHCVVLEGMRDWIETDPAEYPSDEMRQVRSALQTGRFETKGSIWCASALEWILDHFPEEFHNDEAIAEGERLVPHAWTIAGHASRLGLPPNRIAELWSRMGLYLMPRLEFSRAAGAYERAAKLLEEAGSSFRKDLAKLYKHMAQARRNDGDMDSARTSLEAALAIEEKVYGANHEEVAYTYTTLGSILMELGELGTARQCYISAHKIDLKVHGRHHASVGRDCTNLGLISQELGDLTAAWEHYSEAVEICESVFGNVDTHVAAAVKNLGGLLQVMGDLAKARNYFKRALEIDATLSGENHPDVAQDHNNLGSVLQGLGYTDDALSHFRKALAIYKTVYGAKHQRVAISMNNVANLERARGNLKDAYGMYKEAAVIFTRVLGANHSNTEKVVGNLRSIEQEIKQGKSGPKALG